MVIVGAKPSNNQTNKNNLNTIVEEVNKDITLNRLLIIMILVRIRR